jgi:hypothetical protein
MAASMRSANITTDQRNYFKNFITNNYQDSSEHNSSFTHSQKFFILNLIKNSSSEITNEYCNVNDSWIRVLRDKLAENLEIENEATIREKNRQPIQDRVEFFKAVISRAILSFKSLQFPGLASNFTGPSAPGKKRFHELGFSQPELNMILCLDIGRILGFRKQVSSDSWIWAGQAYLLKLFCSALCSKTKTSVIG